MTDRDLPPWPREIITEVVDRPSGIVGRDPHRVMRVTFVDVVGDTRVIDIDVERAMPLAVDLITFVGEVNARRYHGITP